MATFAPESNLRLYKNVDITGGQQILFQSKSAQSRYFQSKLISGSYLGNNLTYVRKSGQIKVDILPSVADTVDYLSFTNSNFENRTFYCKVINWEYVNNAVCAFTYYIDYFQTYMFDFTMRSGKILREHLSTVEYEKLQTDYLDMTVPEMFTQEPLAYGSGCEEMKKNTDGYEIQNEDYKLYLCVSQNPDGSEITQNKFVVSGMSLPSGYFVFENSANGSDALKVKINEYVANNNTSAILGLYLLPSSFVSQGAGIVKDLTSKVMNISGYNVYNKKLLRFPYRYIRVKTADGNVKEYQIEMFHGHNTGDIAFNMYCNIAGVPMLICTPYKYGHMNDESASTYNFDERIDCFQFPQMPYMTDGYLTYLASAYKNTVSSWTNEAKVARGGETALSNLKLNPDARLEATRSMDRGKTIGQAASDVFNSSNVFDASVNAGANILGNTIMAAMGYGTDLLGAAKRNVQNFTVTGQQELRNLQANTLAQAATIMEGNNFFGDIAGVASAAANGEYPSGNFSGARSAYVANDFHPGGADNYLAYKNNEICPQFQIVELRPDLLEKYDQFLKLYGLCSDRVGYPRVYNYIKNSSNQPKFVSGITGMTGEFAYTIMENCRVIGVNDTAAKFIETIFNSGCWFIKGESLL